MLFRSALLFITFGLHLLFVLLMLGTALLSLIFFLRDLLRQPSPSQHWNEHVAHSHMGLKSLAVVLGVAPLLIMQVSHSHAFFTVTVLFSYSWIAIIPLLITAFLLFDAFAHKLGACAWLALICACGLGFMSQGRPCRVMRCMACIPAGTAWPFDLQRGFLWLGFICWWPAFWKWSGPSP